MSLLPSDAPPKSGLSRCPVCDGADREPVLRLPDLPVDLNSQRVPADAESVTRGPVDLVVCCACGHLYNRTFDAALLGYSPSYENSLHFSGRFRVFAEELADRLVLDHGLVGGAVVEVGCGPGHFLSMLCERGVGTGLGFDPSYDPTRLGAPNHPRVHVSNRMLPAEPVRADLALSQHVLEHLEDPVGLLGQFRQMIAPDGHVYSEVPNGELMLDQLAIWDLLYEHVSYFTAASLDAAQLRAGLRPVHSGAAFGNQFLWSDAAAGEPAGCLAEPDLVADLVERATKFGRRAVLRVEEAGSQLQRYLDKGPVVVWGAGTKGMTYLNLVEGAQRVAGVIDINPRKHGYGVPGTGLVISGPEVIATMRRPTVLVANPIYVREIRSELDALVVDPTVIALWGE